MFSGWPIEADEEYVRWKAIYSLADCHYFVHLYFNLSHLGKQQF